MFLFSLRLVAMLGYVGMLFPTSVNARARARVVGDLLKRQDTESLVLEWPLSGYAAIGQPQVQPILADPQRYGPSQWLRT